MMSVWPLATSKWRGGRTRRASNRSRGVAGFVQVAPGKYSDEDI